MIEIWTHSADACILVMSCVGYVRARLKTLSSLLKRRIVYSYAYPGTFNSAVITNKEARMVYGSMKKDGEASQTASAGEKRSSKSGKPSCSG